MLLHLLRSHIIEVVKNFSKHLYHIFLIPIIVLHMRMPYEICHFIGDNYRIWTFKAHVDKLNIMPVALLKIK